MKIEKKELVLVEDNKPEKFESPRILLPILFHIWTCLQYRQVDTTQQDHFPVTLDCNLEIVAKRR